MIFSKYHVTCCKKLNLKVIVMHVKLKCETIKLVSECLFCKTVRVVVHITRCFRCSFIMVIQVPICIYFMSCTLYFV